MADQENSHFIEVVSGVMKLQNSIFIENEYVKNKKDFLEKFKTELQHIEKEIELKETIKKEIIEKENRVDDNILSVSNMRKMARAHEHSLLHELEEEQNKTQSYNIKYQQTISKYETLWQEYEDTYNNLSYVHERNQQKSSLKLLIIDLKKHEAQTIQINKKFQLLRRIQAKKKQTVILNLAELLTERNAFLQKRAGIIKEIEECKKKIEDMRAEKMQLLRTGIKRPYRPEISGTGISQISVSIMDLMQNGLALETPLWDSPPRKMKCYNQDGGSAGIIGESTPATSHSQAHDGRDTSLTSEQSAVEDTINTFQETMPTGNHDTITEHCVSDQPEAQGNEAHHIPQQYENPRSIIERDERLSSVFSENQMLSSLHEQNLSSCSDTMEVNEERSLEHNDIARTKEDGSLQNSHNRSQSSSISTALQIEKDTFEVSIERKNEKSTLNQEISQNKNKTTPIISTKTTDTVHRQLQGERSSTQTTYNRDKRSPNSQIILQRDGSMPDQMQASLQKEDRLPLIYTNTSMQRNGGSTVLQGVTQRGNDRHMPLQEVPQRDYRSNQIQAEIQYEMRFNDGDQTANQQNILKGRRDSITNNKQSIGRSLQNSRQNDGRSNATEDDLVRERDDFLPQNNGSGNHASRLICENDKTMTEINSVSSTAFQQTEQIRESETENTSNFFQTSLNFAQSDLFPDCNRSRQTADSMDTASDTENNVALSPEEPTMTTSEANREQSENSNAQSSSGCASEVGAVWEQQSEVDAFVPSPEGYNEGNFILNSPSISYEENALSPSASLIVSPEGNDKCDTVKALQGLDNQNNTNTGFSFNFGSSTSNFMSNMSSIFQRNNGNQDNNREQSKMGGIFSLF